MERDGVDRKAGAAGDNPVLNAALMERTQRALTLTLGILLVSLPALLFFTYSVTGERERTFLMILIVLVAVLWLLVRAGNVRVALYGIVIGFIIYAVAQLTAYGSVRGSAVLAFVGAIVLGGLFLGRLALSIAVLASLASVGWLIYAENAGLLAQPNFGVGWRHWFVYAIIFSALAAIAYLARSLIEDAARSLSVELAERRRVERELGHTEEIFRVMFRNSPAALVISTAEGRTVDVNDAYERVFGISRDRALGILASDLGIWPAPEERDAYMAELNAAGRINSRRLRFRRADGEVFEAVCSTEIIVWRGASHLFTTITDISAEARVLDALKASEERFSRAFHLSPIGMTITRLSDGTILEVNAADERTLGLKRDESIGRTSVKTGAWVDAAARQKFVDQLLREGRVDGYEARMRHRDGYLFDCRIFAERIEIGGEDCILASILNVSEEKRHEREIVELNQSLEARVRSRTRQLEEANAELEAFSYSVSHDLRSPLRAVEGFTRFLAEDLDGKLATEARDYMDRIVANCERMNHLIDGLLGLSRVGRYEFVRIQVDISAIACEVGDKLRQAAPERVVDFAVEPDMRCECDHELVRLVLDNLIDNAWKFTGRVDSPRIRVGREHGESGADVFFVADNGAGFDMAYADKLFAPFQRLHRRDEYEGTGIGLATVRRIVARHEGRIWAESQPGRGSTFRFTLERG